MLCFQNLTVSRHIKHCELREILSCSCFSLKLIYKSLLAESSTSKIEVAISFEILMFINQSVRRHIPKYHNTTAVKNSKPIKPK